MNLSPYSFWERGLLIGNMPTYHRVAKLGRHSTLPGRGLHAMNVRHTILVQGAAQFPGEQSPILHNLFCISWASHEGRHVKESIIHHWHQLHIVKLHF